MPCNSSDGMGDAYREDPRARNQITDLRRKNDDLTSMLCSLLRALSANMPIPPDVVQWFHAHKEWDKSQGRE